MKYLKILFGKKAEKKSQPLIDSNESVLEETDGKESAQILDDVQNVYHLLIVDESASMQVIQKQTVDGCNETISHIKVLQEKSKDIQRHYLSLYSFYGGGMRYIMKSQPIDNVALLTLDDYMPRSNTPLYDALGTTLLDLECYMHKSVSSLGYVAIITDGYENSSRHYSEYDVRRIISRLKERRVVFSFIGANIDVDKVAEGLNIGNATKFSQTDEGTHEMWRDEILDKERYMAKSMYYNLCREIGAENAVAEERRWINRQNTGALKYKREVDESRITPDYVSSLKENEVFVFGSNVLGHHNGSAAGMAVAMFGAKYGQAEGLQGQSYAIPTDYSIVHKPNDMREIFSSVWRFTEFAKKHPEFTFLVTAVGTGNAGISPMRMASMFYAASKLPNVKLPKNFWYYL